MWTINEVLLHHGNPEGGRLLQEAAVVRDLVHESSEIGRGVAEQKVSDARKRKEIMRNLLHL